MKTKLVPILVAFLLIVIGNVNAQFPFESGNIVVVRVGNGETLSPSGNRVFLDEYDTAGNKVQSIALPYSGTNKLVLDGTDPYCGYLSRSADNKYLTLAGFDATPGGVSSLDASDPATINRMVAVIGIDASIDLTTRYNNITRTPRGVASTDGTRFWISAPSFSSAKPWILYGTKGDTKNTAIFTPASTKEKFYNLRIFSDKGKSRVFFTRSNGVYTFQGYHVDALPTTGIDASYDTGAGASDYIVNDFVLLDQNAFMKHLNVCYTTTNDAYGLRKVSDISNHYSDSNGTYYFSNFLGTVYTMDTCKYYGITIGSYTDSTAVLFATRYNSVTGRYELVKITDNSGWNADPAGNSTIEVLASATSGTAFRGVALAPQQKSEQYYQSDRGINKEYIDSTFTLPVQTSAGLDITYTVADEAVATVSGNTVTIHGAGSTVITATQAGNDGFLPLECTIALNIAKSKQRVKSWTLTEKNTIINNEGYNGSTGMLISSIGDSNFTLEANLNSGLDYYFYSDNDEIAEPDGKSISIGKVAGTATIYVIQEGDDNFYPLENSTTYRYYDKDFCIGDSCGYYVYYTCNNYFKIKVTEATGINETEVGTGLQLYPNPVKGNSLTLSYPQTTEATSLKIYSISGTLLLQQDIDKGSTGTGINVKNIPAGIYLLKMGNKTVKLVKE